MRAGELPVAAIASAKAAAATGGKLVGPDEQEDGVQVFQWAAVHGVSGERVCTSAGDSDAGASDAGALASSISGGVASDI